MKTIHAIYENGVLRPTYPIDLPDKTEVAVELHPIKGKVSLSPTSHLARYVGAIKNLPVDPVEFQRKLREEWD